MPNNAEKLKAIVASPSLWIKYFCKIVDKTGKLVPFELNPQQSELLGNLDKYNIILKSRQLGITSVACALSLYYCHTEKNITCILMSYSIDSARGIFDKLKQIYNEIPQGVKQPEITNNRQELKLQNGSKIIVCTCGTKDVARGHTTKFIHLSEYAFFRHDRAKKNLLALEQSLRPDGKIIIESTANGLNHFSEHYQKAEQGDNMYNAFFFSWIEDKLMFKEEYAQFVNRYLLTNNRLPLPNELDETERALMEQGASIQQIIWRKLKIANSSDEEFKQEFPSNPIEAFITTGANVFDVSIIHERLPNRHNSIQPPEQFENSPITFWKLPEAGQKYYFGVDTAEGIGLDYSVIEVVDKEGYQCAELYSNTIKPYRLSEILIDLANYYNSAFCVIEKASAGHTVVDKMRNEYHYPNLYKSKQYDSTGRIKRKAGWETTSKSRPIMIGDFVEAFENGEIWINSKTLYNQMKLFINKDGRAEHRGSSGDDTVIAFALAIQGIKAGIWYL